MKIPVPSELPVVFPMLRQMFYEQFSVALPLLPPFPPSSFLTPSFYILSSSASPRGKPWGAPAQACRWVVSVSYLSLSFILPAASADKTLEWLPSISAQSSYGGPSETMEEVKQWKPHSRWSAGAPDPPLPPGPAMLLPIPGFPIVLLPTPTPTCFLCSI